MSKGSTRRPEDASKVSAGWDQIFGKKYHSIIVDGFTFPNKQLLPNRTLAFDDRELLYKLKQEPTAEQKQEFAKMLNTPYGL